MFATNKAKTLALVFAEEFLEPGVKCRHGECLISLRAECLLPFQHSPGGPRLTGAGGHAAQHVLPAASRGSVRFPCSLKGAAQIPPFPKSQMYCHPLFGILKANFKASIMVVFFFFFHMLELSRHIAYLFLAP